MSNYSPRAGSKGALAVAALLDGPMTTAELGGSISCDPGSVSAFIKPVLDHGQIIKLKDESGLLHFALAGMPVDERFVAHGGGPGKSSSCLGKALTAAPLIRKIKSQPEVTAAALAAANPFARRSAPAAEVVEPIIVTPQSTKKPSAPAAVISPPPAPSVKPDFVVGIFSNREIVITLGEQSMTLNAHFAHQLRTFLNNYQEQV